MAAESFSRFPLATPQRPRRPQTRTPQAARGRHARSGCVVRLNVVSLPTPLLLNAEEEVPDYSGAP